MNIGRSFTLGLVAATLVACAPVDDTTGSRLTQPPAGTPPVKPIAANDIAIVGQEFSHSIMELPVVANASVPPLVQFNGVTSIVDKPIDTEPYTELLRDRLLLITREKLRFVEHTLPPYVPPSKRKKAAPAPSSAPESADYEILAELRGHAEAPLYRIQIEFVDIHTNEVLFNSVYSIRPEGSTMEEAPSPSGGNNDSPPPPMENDPSIPTPSPQGPSGNTTL